MLPPNFSRKIRLEEEAAEQERLARKGSAASIVEITALPPMPTKKRPSGLRRVFSSLGGGNKKENSTMRATWMNRQEKDAGTETDLKDNTIVQY
jgi:hypothetical protein